MGYIETILEPGERITYRAYLHWFIYSRAVVLMLVGFIGIGWAVFGKAQDGQGALLIGLILFLLGVLSTLRAVIDRRTTEIAVTNQRIIQKRGLIRRDTIELNVPKIESVDVRQSILGRLLNHGTVIVRGTGGSSNPLAYVSEPLKLRHAIFPRRSSDTAMLWPC